MAEFKKIFYSIDKDNTGVITSADLRNHMQKMRYKEGFVTTWTSLFDPEHTGIITYEKYCKVLGLKQEDRPSPPPSPGKDSNSHPIESQIKPKDSEPVKAEPVIQNPEKWNSKNSESKCQRNTESVSKEDSSSNHPEAQEPSNKLNSKSSSVKAIEQPKEVSGKGSRKRKYTKSPSKENLITPIASKSNVEAHSPENCEMEMKSEPMNLTADPQAAESITPQKVEQPSSEKSSQKSKVDQSGKVKNTKKDRSHKTLEKSSQESPEVESKLEGTNEGDLGADIFDFLIASKSNPIQITDEFSDEEPSKPTNEEMVEPIPVSKSKSPTNSKAQKSPKPMDVRQEKFKESKRKRKPKPSKTIEKKPSDEKGELSEDSGMNIFDFVIAAKDSPMEASDDFDHQPLDTVVSEIAEHTVVANPTLLHESEKDKPDQRSKNRSRKVSEKSEHKSPNEVKDISTSSQEQQEPGGDIFDWLIETKDHTMEIIDDEDMKPTSTETSEKSFESKQEPLKNTKKSRAPERGNENVCKEVIKVSEAAKRSKKPSEPTVRHVNQTQDISEEQSQDPKHLRQISGSSKLEEIKEHAPEEIQLEDSRKNKEKGQKNESKIFESSRRLSEDKTVPGSLGQSESTKKSRQDGKKRGKKASESLSQSPIEFTMQREKRSSESSNAKMEIEPTIASCSLQSIPPTEGNQNRSHSGKRLKDSFESSFTHHEPKKAPKNKRQKNPPETKPFKPAELIDVEMNTVQEVLVPAVETPVRSDNLHLLKMHPTEITPTPMEIEIASVLTEDQGFSKPPVVPKYVTEPKEENAKLPESGKKRNKEASESSTKGHMKRLTEKTSPEQWQSSKDATTFADKESKRNMKSSPGDKGTVPSVDIEVIPSASAPHESSMSTVESGIVPMNEVVLEAPVPSIERKELKKNEKPSESSVVEITENIPLAEVSTQETSKHSKPEDETKAPQSVENEEMEIKLPKKNALEAKVVPVEQGATKKPPKSKKASNSPPGKGETHHVLKSSDEHINDKKKAKSKRTSDSMKEADKRSPTKHKPAEELTPPSFSPVLESATGESQKEKSYVANQDESAESKKKTTQKSEDTVKPTEFRYELTEQKESNKKCSESKKQPESFSEKLETEDIMKPSEGARDDKKINQPKKQPKHTKESENKPTIEHKPAEELKSVSHESAIPSSKIQKESSKTNSIGKQDKPKDSKKKALRNSNEESKATTSKMHNSPPDSTPAKQSETGQDSRGEKKKAKPLERTLGKIKIPQTLEFCEGGLEFTNQPPKELKSANREDGAASKKRTNKKRKATDADDDSSSKKYKKVGKNLKKKTDDNEKKRKERKRPQPGKEGDEGTGKKSAKRPRIGNLECGRFPKAFAVQVPHRVAQHRRDGAPVSTHALGKATKGFFTKMSVASRNRNKPSKAIQRWKLRKSLQRVGTVVILLAGRHRGKRAVVLGRHKFSGLLLITGPFKVNGIPIRRVHPDYVIATKTVIKMDKIRLPGRMQTREYFARQKPDDKSKGTADNLFVSSSTDRKAYVLKDERKEDQKLIDKRVIAAIKQTKTAKMLFAYLRSQFSLSRTDRPHKMVF